MSPELKSYFIENFLAVMLNSDFQVVKILKDIMIGICVDAKGYINVYPEMMNVRK
jgi:hypothetical protein